MTTQKDLPCAKNGGLQSSTSALQAERRTWTPQLPEGLKGPVVAVEDTGAATLSSPDDAAVLKKLFPNTSDQKFIRLQASPNKSAWETHPPMRVGVVLSGGQAPGGHNVIAGLFDYIKQCNGNSQLFGFLNGPHGIFSSNYRAIDPDYMSLFRNQGGFHMICSGRHKIETEEQKAASLAVCKKLDLHGLVVIGGDDSNTNAAILAEYFKANKSTTLVVGCPKTIDGDLKNAYVETSFGFDTAVKTYSELVGNLCSDAATSKDRYHFVRLMGRSASNIAFECALQTRPNLCFIGEEVKRDNRSLDSLVDEIVELVEMRAKEGKHYGVILLPEGLIEFIPEVGKLICEINDIVATGEFDSSKLTQQSKHVFQSLPKSIADYLLLERDPHGNVQVAKIATEKLLILMTQARLQAKGLDKNFFPTAHYFGYEGRCALPSNFDANYCYSLGHTAGALLDLGKTGYMAVVQNLQKPVKEWAAAGCPLQSMMNIERRHGKDVPVIKKYLVELDSPTFKLFVKARSAWKNGDVYRNPGPIQFSGPVADITNFSIQPPTDSDVLPTVPFNLNELKKRYNFVKSESYLSPLQVERINAKVEVAPLLTKATAKAVPGLKCQIDDQEGQKFVKQAFPLQSDSHNLRLLTLVDDSSHNQCQNKKLKIGVVLQGQQAPGCNNIIQGLFERLSSLPSGGTLIGFKGIQGLLDNDYIEITAEDLRVYYNQGGFEMLGHTPDITSMRTDAGLAKVRKTCQSLSLDGLVMIGGPTSFTDAALIAEHLLAEKCSTVVVAVPATQENNLRHSLIEACVGFDSTSRCYSSLIGNLLTDAASASKYWYFVRVMGHIPSHVVLEAALQTHPNVAIIGERYQSDGRDLYDVVSDIADVVAERSECGKNFGTVLVPEGLIAQLPNLRHLASEIESITAELSVDKLNELRTKLMSGSDEDELLVSKLLPVHKALFKSLPPFFKAQFVQKPGKIDLTEINTEELLAHLVDVELKERRRNGRYKGSFSPVCHYLGFQGRSTLPSEFDCRLGLAHGYLACFVVESGFTGYATSIRGLCGPLSNWKMAAFPITAMMKVVPEREMKIYGRQVPIVPSAEVNLQGNPYVDVDSAAEKWESEDLFCNPGPIQFSGEAAGYHNRTLFEEQHYYLMMVDKLDELTSYIETVCSFGVDESTLKTTVLSLEGLVKILNRLQVKHTTGPMRMY